MRRSIAAVAVLLVALLAPPATAAGPRVTTTSGRTILVNGTPYTVKGFNYVSGSIPDTWPAAAFSIDPVACRNDAELLSAAGVNTLRIWWTFLGAGTTLQRETECLDAFWAKGIGVVWTIVGPGGAPVTPGYFEAYKPVIDEALRRFKNHPATLMWLLGNEWELRCNQDAVFANCRRDALGGPGKVGIIDSWIVYTRAQDPNHLVGTTICCGLSSIGSWNMPNLQIWGMNTYPSLNSPSEVAAFGTLLSNLTTWEPTRPKIFTEIGTDRFWCNRRIAASSGVNTSLICTTTGGSPPATSGEWAQPQAKYFTDVLDTIAAHSGDVAGATLFMWTDMWDKCSLLCAGTNTPVTHDVGNEAIFSGPDGTASAEWWGVAHAIPLNTAYPRVTTPSYDAIQSRWAPVAPPVFTSGPTLMPRVSPCTYDGGSLYRIRATWTTSLPATSEVYASFQGQAANGGGDMIADNSIYDRVVNVTSLSTTHSQPFLLPYGGRGRVIVRSTTATGQSVVSAPMTVTCGDL